MSKPASSFASFINMQRSNSGAVIGMDSVHLTIHSFSNDAMSLIADSEIAGEGTCLVNILRDGSAFSFISALTLEACAQKVGGVDTASEDERCFIIEAESALEREIDNKIKRERVIQQHRAAERQKVCQRVFAAYRGLKVKDVLDSAEQEVYQELEKEDFDLSLNEMNRLAQACGTEGTPLTKDKAILVVRMVRIVQGKKT
jgi:hypothetical protein